MIHLIRKGNVPVIKFECPICGCVFEADYDDYKRTVYISQFDGDCEHVHKVSYEADCPCCDYKVKNIITLSRRGG